jgi:predicted nucleic acid-binding protein
VATLAADGMAHLGASGPLRTHALLTVTGSDPWLSRELVVPDRVVAHLLGCDAQDPDLWPALVPVLPLSLPGAELLARSIERGASLAWVRAPQHTAGVSLAAAAFAAVGLDCLAVDARRVSGGADPMGMLRSAALEAALRGRALIVTGAERLGEPDHTCCLAMLARTPVPVVLVGTRAWDPGWLPWCPLTVDAPVLRPADRDASWQAAHGSPDAGEALAGLRLTPERIAQTAGYVETLAVAQDVPVTAELVRHAARVVGGSHTTGRRPSAGFADLVLPDYVTASLHRLVAWARHRDDVVPLDGHGTDQRGRGIASLFTGSPGTGKTLAADVVAGELGLDLVQIDLSAIVDKYIGETEKNLEKVFDEAESLNVVLFFDEADALFGRRSDVKDAHDRYANQEVAYLLQRMERFDGITILATNLRGNVDHAFSRRMQFIVHFPDPDPPTRARLWNLYLNRLADPDPHDPIDVEHLAGAAEVSGGEIRNIVLAAWYDAAAAGEPVGMRHVLAATAGEYQKLGRRIPAGRFEQVR